MQYGCFSVFRRALLYKWVCLQWQHMHENWWNSHISSAQNKPAVKPFGLLKKKHLKGKRTSYCPTHCPKRNIQNNIILSNPSPFPSLSDVLSYPVVFGFYLLLKKKKHPQWALVHFAVLLGIGSEYGDPAGLAGTWSGGLCKAPKPSGGNYH